MLYVSLDQNFLSEFAKGKAPEAMRLHFLLNMGVTAETLVCPLHARETVFESAMCPADLREKIFSVARNLSRGVGFRNFAASAAIETLQLVRPESQLAPFPPDSLENWIDGDLTQLGTRNRAAKRLYQERIAVHPYPPAQYKPEMMASEILADIVAERAGSMFRLVSAIKDQGNLVTGKSEWEVTEVIARLLVESKIDSEECEKLLHDILNHEWENTPTLLAHSLLCGQLEWDCLKANRQTKPNDHFDLWRLAVSVNFADVVFCDAAMHALATRAGLLESADRARMFSFRQLPDAIAYFECVLGQ